MVRKNIGRSRDVTSAHKVASRIIVVRKNHNVVRKIVERDSPRNVASSGHAISVATPAVPPAVTPAVPTDIRFGHNDNLKFARVGLVVRRRQPGQLISQPGSGERPSEGESREASLSQQAAFAVVRVFAAPHSGS